MRIAFAGTPDVAIPALAALVDSHHSVDLIITRPDAPTGRGKVMTPSAVGQWAEERKLPLLKTSTLSGLDVDFSEFDCVVVIAFGAFVPEIILDAPRHGWINVHFSLLPTWRGAAPVQYAVLHGDETTGATIFQIDKGMDTGPLLTQLVTDIGPRETSGELLDRLARESVVLLLQTLAGMEAGAIRPIPQQAYDVSHAPKVVTADARIDWTQPGLAIERRIRAMTPAPGAWTTDSANETDRVKLAPVKLHSEVVHLQPGHVVSVDGRVLVGTGSCAIELDLIQPPGKKMMNATDWLRGRHEDVVFV